MSYWHTSQKSWVINIKVKLFWFKRFEMLKKYIKYTYGKLYGFKSSGIKAYRLIPFSYSFFKVPS